MNNHCGASTRNSWLHREAALKIVSNLVDTDPRRGTPEADQLEVLGTLLVAYEAKHFPVDLPDP